MPWLLPGLTAALVLSVVYVSWVRLSVSPPVRSQGLEKVSFPLPTVFLPALCALCVTSSLCGVGREPTREGGCAASCSPQSTRGSELVACWWMDACA